MYLILAALFLGGCSTYGVLPGVKGVVLAEDGTYLSAASVELLYGQELRHWQRGETDKTGHFHLEEVRAPSPPDGFMRVMFPAGTGIPSMLEVTADGFEPAVFRFDPGSNAFIPHNRSITDTILGTATPPDDAEQPRNPEIPVKWQHCGGTVWITPVVLSRRPAGVQGGGAGSMPPRCGAHQNLRLRSSTSLRLPHRRATCRSFRSSMSRSASPMAGMYCSM